MLRRSLAPASVFAAAVVAAAALTSLPSAAAAGARPTPATAAVPPGVSTRWAHRLRGHDQVVVALGAGAGSDRVVVTDWTRTADGWTRLGSWSGWVGRRGWTSHHHEGDLHTPVGVWSLTNAGGYLPDPGTRLPYEHDPAYYGLLDNGVRTFAYVVGINYDHVVGSPPSDRRRPLGRSAGGDIWLHVAHGSGTHGCVSIPRAGVRATLRWLRPHDHPVILMGPRSAIGA